MQIPFEHRQTAHCESGVTANLFRHYGMDLTEAQAFGIGGGLFFAYLPFIRVNQLPLTTYRCAVGGIFKRTAKLFGVKVHWQKFRSPRKAMAALDRKLAEGIPVGCRTGGYWLPYFPPEFRFHFNMHNLVVVGREGSDYLISDPVFPEPVRCAAKDLAKARFAKGALAPKGVMYHFKKVPEAVDRRRAVSAGITSVCRTMLKTPGPLVGTKGIRFLAKQMERWPRRLGKRRAALYLGQVIRMQEEIGTGGGGFRFMYAAFLQEAAPILGLTRLDTLSAEMTAIGDRWREFAVLGARHVKNRRNQANGFEEMAAILRECADRETVVYQALLEAVAGTSGEPEN